MIHHIENILRGGIALAAGVAGGGYALGMSELLMIACLVAVLLVCVERLVALVMRVRELVESAQVIRQLGEHTRTWASTAKSIERQQREINERVARIEGTCAAIHPEMAARMRQQQQEDEEQ